MARISLLRPRLFGRHIPLPGRPFGEIRQYVRLFGGQTLSVSRPRRCSGISQPDLPLPVAGAWEASAEHLAVFQTALGNFRGAVCVRQPKYPATSWPNLVRPRVAVRDGPRAHPTTPNLGPAETLTAFCVGSPGDPNVLRPVFARFGPTACGGAPTEPAALWPELLYSAATILGAPPAHLTFSRKYTVYVGTAVRTYDAKYPAISSPGLGDAGAAFPLIRRFRTKVASISGGQSVRAGPPIS